MNKHPDSRGYYGEFGGSYIPEMLYNNVQELCKNYHLILSDSEFNKEYSELLKDYVGRPSPLYFAKNLSNKFGFNVFLKREDLNHTGSHKINNAIGQCLIAKHLGKTRIIAETGAGQHGVATATVCALLNLECTIYMGAKDIIRQSYNVTRMKLLGANITSVSSGSMTLKDATNEAIRDWINNSQNTHYVIGSVVGPHPYPDLVATLQSVISREIKKQIKEHTGRSSPNYIVACIGGGSNSIGAFYEFLDDCSTNLIGVEAAGLGISTTSTAATIQLGSVGILHGSKTLIMQTDDGQIKEAHSISAGLDYPGIGPQHSYLNFIGRVKYSYITDQQAIAAGRLLTRLEGIIPALESAHAIAYLNHIVASQDDSIVVCLSGRGDKDQEIYNGD